MPLPFPAVLRGRRASRIRDLLIVSCWLGGTVLAFAWHGPGGIGPAGGPAVLATFDPADASAVAWLAERASPATDAPRSTTLLHLREPGCRCNTDADRELDALRSAYAERGVRVVTVPVERGGTARPRWLTATPAAALLAADGRLLYLGPLDSPGFCARGGTPMRRALESALAGSPSAAQPMLGTGCFCT
jgi:hypothetical protein